MNIKEPINKNPFSSKSTSKRKLIKNKFLKLTIISTIYLLCMHILALAVFSFYRILQYFLLGKSMISKTAENACIGTAFLNGIKFDNLCSCYILLLPLLILLTASIVGKVGRKLLKGSSFFLCGAYLLTFAASASNIPYFKYFYRTLNYSIFNYASAPKNVVMMLIEEKSYLLFILGYFIISAIFLYFAIKIRQHFKAKFENIEQNTIDNSKHSSVHNESSRTSSRIPACILSIIFIFLCFIGIRGRINSHPLRISEAYYCEDSFLNQLGINPSYSLIKSILDNKGKSSQINLVDVDKALKFADERFADNRLKNIEAKDSKLNNITNISKYDKKNIVIILMESMSGSLMGSFGNPNGLTPNLDSLFNNSLAFSNLYSAGIHTSAGMAATLYSVPAIMTQRFIKQAVVPHAEGLPGILHKYGYQNYFFLAHEPNFDNMKGFFTENGYDKIYSLLDYPADAATNSWGVSDGFLFNFALNNINKLSKKKEPFMATILTMTNHPPYVVPKDNDSRGFYSDKIDIEEQITQYADFCIGHFMNSAKKQDWYDDTIFIIIADHGKLVGKPNSELPRCYNHIPLIIIGSEEENRIYDNMALQIDVMPTLLGLLGMDYSPQGLGVDLTKVKRDMCFYSTDSQLVARDKEYCYIFNPELNREVFYKDNGKDKPILLDTKKIERSTLYSAKMKNLKEYAFNMFQAADYYIRNNY